MEYKPQSAQRIEVAPRLIIHGGAGNITRANIPPEKYQRYRESLVTILRKTHVYQTTAIAKRDDGRAFPSALETATFAATLLEDDPLYNSGCGAVFTRDGVNELEASVMTSRGFAKRGVGVTGLRHVRNPILLARQILERGLEDLGGGGGGERPTPKPPGDARGEGLNVPSAQGHTLIHGETAETLARRYGLHMVEQEYFFTQRRWDEHIRALEKEKAGKGLATWSAEEYLPQGTCGAVALDSDGIICTATTTGGLTNKLTGRIGDTPVVGAGFWAEEWIEEGDPSGEQAPASDGGMWGALRRSLTIQSAPVELSPSLRGLLADCLPTPFMYTPVAGHSVVGQYYTTRSVAMSGTGNGDSFFRTNAVRTVAAISRYSGLSSSKAISQISGPSGELQKSAGDRWGKAGEGEGGMIGIESAIIRDAQGRIAETRSEIIQDHNCAGMLRAWVDEDGEFQFAAWREG